jgi:aminoglycoside phosphotransferase (APT) family kinase protein
MTDTDDLRRRLAAAYGEDIEELARLSGGASQETWAFMRGGERLILRRAPGGVDRAGTAQGIGLAVEAAVICAARRAGAPAPEVTRVFQPTDDLGPAYAMRRLSGETIARKILRDAAHERARSALAAQCGKALAQIHATPRDALPDLPVADAPAQLALYDAIYQSFDAPRPIFDLAFTTLAQSAPPGAAPVLVHGDFRLGNLMVDEAGLVAALDWELAHLGDPAEDLGWLCVPSWRFGVIDKPVGGFGQMEDLLAAYRAAGGAPITEEIVRFWTMFGALKWGIMCLMMQRAFADGVDPSVERATIGRRASEAELDLMLMMGGRL